jgi:hypothetical protein
MKQLRVTSGRRSPNEENSGFQSMSGPGRKSEKWQESITQPPISHPIVAMPLSSISEALNLVIGNFRNIFEAATKKSLFLWQSSNIFKV